MFSAKIVLSWLNPIFELQYRVEPAQQYIHLLKFGLIRINSQKKEEGEKEKHCPFLPLLSPLFLFCFLLSKLNSKKSGKNDFFRDFCLCGLLLTACGVSPSGCRAPDARTCKQKTAAIDGLRYFPDDPNGCGPVHMFLFVPVT